MHEKREGKWAYKFKRVKCEDCFLDCVLIFILLFFHILIWIFVVIIFSTETSIRYSVNSQHIQKVKYRSLFFFLLLTFFFLTYISPFSPFPLNLAHRSSILSSEYANRTLASRYFKLCTPSLYTWRASTEMSRTSPL